MYSDCRRRNKAQTVCGVPPRGVIRTAQWKKGKVAGAIRPVSPWHGRPTSQTSRCSREFIFSGRSFFQSLIADGSLPSISTDIRPISTGLIFKWKRSKPPGQVRISLEQFVTFWWTFYICKTLLTLCTCSICYINLLNDNLPCRYRRTNLILSKVMRWENLAFCMNTRKGLYFRYVITGFQP